MVTGATVEVADTGCGVEESQLPHLFDQFFRAAPPDVEGSGLGLAIVDAIAKRHGLMSLPPDTTKAIATIFGHAENFIAEGKGSEAKKGIAPSAAGEISFDVNSRAKLVSSIVINTKENGIVGLGALVDDIKINAKRIGYFSINPGKWFNVQAIRYFKDGPWVNGPIKDGTYKLWGKGGALGLLPVGVIVAYGITADIKAKPNCFDALKASLDKADKISVGPVQVNTRCQDIVFTGIKIGACFPEAIQPSPPPLKPPSAPSTTTSNPETQTISVGLPDSAQIIAVDVAVMPEL